MPVRGSEPGRRTHQVGIAETDAELDGGPELTELVIAARSGDRRAAEDLIAAHLPLLYRVVGRALDGHADVDDVVQETILRAHRDLPHLRTPASFRSWLLAIAMHQISSRLRSWQQDRSRSVPLDDAVLLPDPGADFADVTLLRVTMSDQRRQVAEASRWLDPGDRELAALWWRETSGELTRPEVVAAIGVDPAHARVRIQRMRQQLELSRFVVAALDTEPRCPRLDAVAAGWDGTPRPRWRKRFARHVRDCEFCAPVRADFLPLERLLAGASLVLVPGVAGVAALSEASLTAGSAAHLGAAGTTAGTGVAGWIGQVVGTKAVAVMVVGATVSGGVYLALPDDPAKPPRAVASAAAVAAPEQEATPTARPRQTRAADDDPGTSDPGPAGPSGPPSANGYVDALIRPANRPYAVMTTDGDALIVAPGRPGTVVTVVSGLADRNCLSFRAADGRYVRHAQFRLVLHKDEGTDLYRKDATFCSRPGPTAGTVRLASLNYPGRFIRVRDNRLVLDLGETNPVYEAESTFTITTP